MSRGRTLIVDRLTLHLPRGASASPRALAREIGRALAAEAGTAAQARLAVAADPPCRGEAASAFTRRVAQAVARRGGTDAG
jgi:hypothetical protein